MFHYMKEEKGRDFSLYLYLLDEISVTGESHNDHAELCHLVKWISGMKINFYIEM